MIAWFATKGSGSNDAIRMQKLLSRSPCVEEFPFDRKAKWDSLLRLLRTLRDRRPRLLIMEGTGLAGGLACLFGRFLWKIPYVVSSGDAVGPFLKAHHPAIGFAGHIYERWLCRYSAGFIGWTPYLVGRALTFGSPSGVTAAGWSEEPPKEATRVAGAAFRKRLGIPQDHLVIGIVGSLEWNAHCQYCYGYDLVMAAHRSARTDISFLIVGGGTGLERLKQNAGELLGKRVFLPGPVPAEEVPIALAAFDIASLPQSVDGVGSFRYTTKLAEYLTAGLPVITTQIPMAYDLDEGWLWRIPGGNPWSERYLDGLVDLLARLSARTIAEKRARVPSKVREFEREGQIDRISNFLEELLADMGAANSREGG